MRRICTLLSIALYVALSSVVMAQSPAKQAVVFVPGILGSKLADEGRALWGSDVLGSLRQFTKLQYSANSKDLSISSYKADCLLEKAHVLSKHLASSVYAGLVEFLRSSGYREGEDLFIFCYDWRRSVFKIADELNKFLTSHPRLADRNVDLVVHSMGGLVGRAFIQTYPYTARRVHTFVELAVPHRGSISILSTLYEGWGTASKVIAGGIDNIRRVVFSFDSFFELLPWYANCCGLGFSPPNTPRLDFRNAAVWSGDLRWLLPADMPIEQIEAQAKEGAGRLAKLMLLMERPLPPHMKHAVFAGRWQETNESVYVLKDRLAYRVSPREGDGTVHTSSARAFDEVPYPSFAKHRYIFDDQYLRTVLTDVLNAKAIEPVSGPSPSLSNREVVGISSRLDCTFCEPGKPMSYVLRLTLADAEGLALPDGSAVLRSEAGTTLSELRLISRKLDAKTIELIGSLVSPTEPGLYELSVSVANLAPQPKIDELLVVSDAPK